MSKTENCIYVTLTVTKRRVPVKVLSTFCVCSVQTEQRCGRGLNRPSPTCFGGQTPTCLRCHPPTIVERSFPPTTSRNFVGPTSHLPLPATPSETDLVSETDPW